MPSCRVFLALATAALAGAPPAYAQATAPRLSLTPPLRPGEFRWAPQVAPIGPVLVIVSLKAQRAQVYRNGVLIGVSTVSSGKKGHATPTGVFTILQKAVDHKSNLYSDAPMPFMQRLTWDGIAMHAGALPGYPASHGCIRLPLAFAKLLFGVTRLGLTVVITDDPALPVIVPAPALLDQTVAGDPGTDFTWTPEKSPGGPVSIVVSGADARLVVLRNGIEIGSSAIRLDAPVDRTAAFSLRDIDAQGTHWLRLPLPGQPTQSGELTPEERGRGHLPEAFRAALAAVVAPGTTILVTPSSLDSGGTGHALTVIAADRR